MEVCLKSIINIFTIIDSEVYLLYKDNKNIELICESDIEQINNEYIKNNLNINNLKLEQVFTYTEIYKDKLNVYVLYADIINNNDIILSSGYSFEKITNMIDDKLMNYLKNKIILNSTIKRIYSKEFSLPEIQKLYENILNKKYDRRNFRKKLIKQDIIEELNKTDLNKFGRPAKLYKFKDIIEDKSIL